VQEEGQGLVEYGLILILVAVAIVAALTLAGQEVADLFSRVSDAFN
jgi:pilus assembly protein Flp/PilA